MPRILPPCPPPPEMVLAERYPGKQRDLFEIDVITPLFGGGVEARTNDPVTIIRGSSIRGHLRFWWRATRGRSLPDLAALRKREGEIWGTPEVPSEVTIEVEIRNAGREETTGPSHPVYAVFPFQA